LCELKQRGDKTVVHGLRGKPSNRRMEESTEKEAVKILWAPVYQGFGPTLAAEYLEQKHGIGASKETVRQWMIRGKLWRAKKERSSMCTAGGHIGADSGSWCSGTPACTTGWRDGARSCT
jgi:hypothetical protein